MSGRLQKSDSQTERVTDETAAPLAVVALPSLCCLLSAVAPASSSLLLLLDC